MPISTIDIGERWAAVIGVRPVLTKAVEKITISQRGKAATLEKELAKQANALCSGALSASFASVPEYSVLSDELSGTFGQAQVEDMIAQVAPDAKLPYMTIAKRQFDMLSALLPRNAVNSVSRTFDLPVSDADMSVFSFVYNVINDPLSVFGLIADCAILKKQVIAMREVFPSLSSAIDMSIQDAITAHLEKNSKYRMPEIAELGFRTWKGLPNPVIPYQAAYVDGGKKREAQPSPSQAARSAAATSSMTSAQRALYDQVK